MGVKLDGIDPQKEWGLIFLRDHYHPATPEMRNRTMSIPGMTGEWDFGSEWGSRPFSLPFGLIDYDRYELQRKLRAFVAFLVDAYGKPREIKLSFDYEPDKYYSVKVSSRVDVERAIFSGQLSLPLVAHKPYAKSATTSDNYILDSDISVMADIMLDTGLSNRVITSPQTFEVINNGSVAIPFTFNVEGSGTNVTFSTNGKTLSLGSFSNKTIEIQDNYVIKFDGVADLTSTNGVFIELMPGVNTITVNGTNLNLTVSESLTYQYI
jgi:phage-related protein